MILQGNYHQKTLSSAFQAQSSLPWFDYVIDSSGSLLGSFPLKSHLSSYLQRDKEVFLISLAHYPSWKLQADFLPSVLCPGSHMRVHAPAQLWSSLNLKIPSCPLKDPHISGAGITQGALSLHILWAHPPSCCSHLGLPILLEKVWGVIELTQSNSCLWRRAWHYLQTSSLPGGPCSPSSSAPSLQ